MSAKPAVSKATTPNGGAQTNHQPSPALSGPSAGALVSTAQARAHVLEIVSASRTSFQTGMRILPQPRREAMYAIYAFCREVDDIADEPAPNEQKRRQLAEWRTAIEALYIGQPNTPITIALVEPVAKYGLKRNDFLAVIEGMEMDAFEAICGPTLAELDCYCDRVASAVGRLSVKAFGATEPAADDVAHALGRALQLTNILRDLNEDAERGRLYLPAELLDAHGVDTRDPAAVLAHPNLSSVCEALAQVARGHYRDAANALARCERRPMRPAIVMMEAYRRVLDALQRRGWERHTEQVSIGKLTKLWIIFRYGLI